MKDVRPRASCCPVRQRHGQAGGVAGTKWELPAGFCYRLSLSCRQAQDKLCSWLICAAQHRLWLLGLPVMWISDSSMYCGVLVRIAIFHPLIHIQFTFTSYIISYKLY